MVSSRGGVEDTRLEAKAKNTKKIQGQGQGQPFRGQTLSRPRTGMLEANAKDQGRKRKCSQKKKVFKIFFQAISKKNGLEKNFSADLQNFYHSKNSAVFELRTGKFLRTWGFEAKTWSFRPRPRTSKCVFEAVVPKQEEDGGIYSPNNLAVSPAIIWEWFTSASPSKTLMGVHLNENLGKKVFYSCWRPFLLLFYFIFLVFTWIWEKSALFLMKIFFLVFTWIWGKKCSICFFWGGLH